MMNGADRYRYELHDIIVWIQWEICIDISCFIDRMKFNCSICLWDNNWKLKVGKDAMTWQAFEYSSMEYFDSIWKWRVGNSIFVKMKSSHANNERSSRLVEVIRLDPTPTMSKYCFRLCKSKNGNITDYLVRLAKRHILLSCSMQIFTQWTLLKFFKWLVKKKKQKFDYRERINIHAHLAIMDKTNAILQSGNLALNLLFHINIRTM